MRRPGRSIGSSCGEGRIRREEVVKFRKLCVPAQVVSCILADESVSRKGLTVKDEKSLGRRGIFPRETGRGDEGKAEMRRSERFEFRVGRGGRGGRGGETVFS